jgi:hypothetical protein
MTYELSIVLFLVLISLKHFVADFILQTKYQWYTKGIYGHLGGVLHASIHAVLTFLVLIHFLDFGNSITVSLVDGLIHYQIDYFKVVINEKYGLDAGNEKFWWLLGLDQLLHSLTYIGILYYLIK